GDGPSTSRTYPLSSTSPPHARGWTCVSRLPLGPRDLSPARAGMDLVSGNTESLDEALPRTRGDGPSSLVSSCPGVGSPPHARGWTRGGQFWEVSDRLSPARAGMDLSST